MISAPVALFIFNRPDTTARVFAEIARAKPSRLMVVADGPRPERPGEGEQCRAAREATENVSWGCEVLREYSDVNLGCRRRVSSGMDWVFANAGEAIILEDDCLPSRSFFGYCQELLEYYRNDTRVMQICGTNVLREWSSAASYFFSNYGPIWGWASWRRAWKHYDVAMSVWPRIREGRALRHLCLSDEEAEYRKSFYDRVYDNRIDTWDYQWGFAKLINSGLSVIPSGNMVSNIGFRGDATHTVDESDNANLPLFEIELPLKHPGHMVRDRDYDVRYNGTYLQKREKRIGRVCAGIRRRLHL